MKISNDRFEQRAQTILFVHKESKGKKADLVRLIGQELRTTHDAGRNEVIGNIRDLLDLPSREDIRNERYG